MRKTVIVLLVLSMILSGCSLIQKTNQRKDEDITKIEVVRFMYQNQITGENQKVLKSMEINKLQYIKVFMGMLADKGKPDAQYNLPAPLGRINVLYKNNAKVSYDLWEVSNFYLISESEKKEYYTLKSDLAVKLLKELLD